MLFLQVHALLCADGGAAKAAALLGTAEAHSALGCMAEALGAMVSAGRILEGMGDGPELAQCKAGTATVLSEMGRLDEAAALFVDALGMLTRARAPYAEFMEVLSSYRKVLAKAGKDVRIIEMQEELFRAATAQAEDFFGSAGTSMLGPFE